MKKNLSFLLFGALVLVFSACEKVKMSGHEYVDLGLPSGTLWATCNLGATSPDQLGDYFAWGEIAAKQDFTSSNYKFGKYDSLQLNSGLTKYHFVPKAIVTDLARSIMKDQGIAENEAKTLAADSVIKIYGDTLMLLTAEDDAARVLWGEKWRLPTIAELNELKNPEYCTWTWKCQKGTYGYKIQSKKNKKSIFLPAAGYKDGTNTIQASCGYYWSSSLYPDYAKQNSHLARHLEFHPRDYQPYRGARFFGQSIRPVFSHRNLEK